MNHRGPAPWLGLAALGAALIVVFIAVMDKRFGGGQIYPHYSTLRSDPLGAKALFESLDALPGLETSRNLQNLMLIESLDADSALWLCGVSRASFDSLRGPDDSPVLNAVKEKGARLVITVNPGVVPGEFDLRKEGKTKRELDDWIKRREEARQKKGNDAETAEKGAEKGEAPGKESEPKEKSPIPIDDEEAWDQEMEKTRGPKLTELFAVKLERPDHYRHPEGGWTADAGDGLDPEDLPRWHSPYRFQSLGKEWKVAARVDGDPVAIERHFGKGSLVFTSDSYFASNEALWKGSQPAFLLWLAGGKVRHVFDETIHGTEEGGGAMKMIRRYRFHGFFIGLLLFVALMAWRGGSSLTPGDEDLERGVIGGNAVSGEDTESGFVRLLRRGVPRQRLLRVCLDTWRKTASLRLRGESAAQRAAIDSMVQRHETDPRSLPAVEAYRHIAHALAHPDEFERKS